MFCENQFSLNQENRAGTTALAKSFPHSEPGKLLQLLPSFTSWLERCLLLDLHVDIPITHQTRASIPAEHLGIFSLIPGLLVEKAQGENCRSLQCHSSIPAQLWVVVRRGQSELLAQWPPARKALGIWHGSGMLCNIHKRPSSDYFDQTHGFRIEGKNKTMQQSCLYQ